MVRCIHCGEVHAITRSGIVRGKQRYYCKDCKLYFILKEEATVTPARPHMTTIVDIAKALCISKSTVSRALHEHSDINEQTRNDVLDMARKLDYQPNLLAQSLVKSKSNNIGIIVPEFLTYFFPTIIMAAQEVATKAGYNVIICQSQESYKIEKANAHVLLSNRVDGVLISMSCQTKNFEHFRTFEKHGIPVVFFNRVCEEIDSSKVYVDDYKGSFLAVEHLIKSGYKNIAHIGGPLSLQLTYNRLNGYRAALKKYGLPSGKDQVIHCDLSKKGAINAAETLLSKRRNRPDAVFCVNDPVAIQLIMVARQKKIPVPRELGVVGFSDDPMAEIIDPGLTTIQQPVSVIGREAMELLLRSIQTEGKAQPIVKSLKPKLVIRGSSVR
ncbi:LacI family DNA-binding transcriptional regulator [Niabella soli]|uniref:LacI family transcription regulator n=1 Tax=Niabella soli DSM 19437 TaxID=929713 RepID=W0F3F9_9BACT|nr:substrate-binding domain-containing protein [Niabella soli]AHF16034.1 LacI family transcription regulator [Niabella soli DSM 19437]